jgi:fatty acid desaturase
MNMKTTIIFEDKRWDITDWIQTHPGGKQMLLSADGCDITEVFKSYHTMNNFSHINGIKFIDHATPTHKPYIFTDSYRKMQKTLYQNTPSVTCFDPWDIVMWMSFVAYLYDINPVISGILLIILGSFGHQYVHISSHKSSMLTLVGFISNQWRDEHVFQHHPWTNTEHDPDLNGFLAINDIPLPSICKFVIVSNIIVIRPFIQYFIPAYFIRATMWDIAAMTYNIFDILKSFTHGWTSIFNWWLKRIIPAAWFLTIDYFNHYRTNDVVLKQVSNDWTYQQKMASQNFVFSSCLYQNAPTIHSLLTFGLDRQVEHHLFPKLRLKHLQYAETFLKDTPQKHTFGLHSLKIIFSEFV